MDKNRGSTVIVLLLCVSCCINALESPKKQISDLHRLENAGVAYHIPDGVTFDQFFQGFKNATPSSKEISSEGYPHAYPVGLNQKFTIDLENSTGVELIIHSLDISPQTDYLKLTPIDENGVERKPIVLTGKLLQPLKFQSLGIPKVEITFGAWTEADHQHRGFLISYIPHGTGRQPLPPAADLRTPYEELQTISKFIVVNKELQANQTWTELKEVICEATNTYVAQTYSILEECHTDNVTFTAIMSCPEYWPDSSNCIEMTFAVSLYQNRSLVAASDVDAFLDQFTARSPAGLNATELTRMWARVGHSTFARRNFQEYNLPDATGRIYMWITIVFGSLLLILFVLVGVFRSPMFRDKWLQEGQSQTSPLDIVAVQKPDDDITMYASTPEQTMSDLYPGSNNADRKSMTSSYNEWNGMDNGRSRMSVKGGSKITEAVIEEEPKNGLEMNPMSGNSKSTALAGGSSSSCS